MRATVTNIDGPKFDWSVARNHSFNFTTTGPAILQ